MKNTLFYDLMEFFFFLGANIWRGLGVPPVIWPLNSYGLQEKRRSSLNLQKPLVSNGFCLKTHKTFKKTNDFPLFLCSVLRVFRDV